MVDTLNLTYNLSPSESQMGASILILHTLVRPPARLTTSQGTVEMVKSGNNLPLRYLHRSAHPQKFPGLTQDTLQPAVPAVGGAVPPDILRKPAERGYHYTVFVLVDWSLAMVA